MDSLELRHRLLRATDRALGAEAEAARGREREQALEGDTQALRRRVAQLERERKALETRIAEMRASQTWRVGRALVRPAARLSRRAGGRGERTS